MTTATFMTADIAAAARDAMTKLGVADNGRPKPGPEFGRVTNVMSLAIGAMHHGEPLMQVSPDDWVLISDAFYDHKHGRNQ